MLNFQELIAQGAANAWLFVPTAILLGALHGLEPGHSKTLMAAFIVAIRGTVAQAFLLGLAATVSHTLVVWGIAIGGMYLWKELNPENAEGWLQLISAIIIIGVALWMFWRIRKDNREAASAQAAAAAFDAQNAGNALNKRIDTGHGFMTLGLAEEGDKARWRLRVLSGDQWQGEYVTLIATRPDGKAQTFTFLDKDGYMESAETFASPYDVTAKLVLDHGDHEHSHEVAFGGAVDPFAAMEGEPMDAHARSHMEDIKKRFVGRGQVTNWQILLFGLTGGLIPCPAAITVLLICLQLKEISLGAVMVLSFSVGLAITLVGVGAVAALSVNQLSKRTSLFSTLAARAPYFSSALILIVGVYMAIHGLNSIRAQGHKAAAAPATIGETLAAPRG